MSGPNDVTKEGLLGALTIANRSVDRLDAEVARLREALDVMAATQTILEDARASNTVFSEKAFVTSFLITRAAAGTGLSYADQLVKRAREHWAAIQEAYPEGEET